MARVAFTNKVMIVDWWGSSEANENFEAPGYSSRGAYLFPHTSCPDKTSLSGADAECRSVCSRDFHCPALQYCCLNTCDRRCVTPQLLDTGDDCGCSVSFLPMKQANDLSPDFVKINAKVVNFIWLSVKDSFSPSMEVHLLDTNFRTTGIGQVDSLCQLENIMQFEFRTKKLDLFKKPHRKLFVIGDDVDFFTRVTEAGVLGEIFESVCAVAVGNVTLSDSLLSQFASTASPGEPCVWRVDSYDQLGDLQPEVEAVINDGNCLCQGDTKGQGACAGPGESCVLDEDCGLMGDCVSGVCRERPCHVPDSYDPSSDINYDYYVEDYYYYYADYYNYFDEYGAGLHIAYDYFYDDGDASIRKQLERSSNTLSQKEKPTVAVREVFTDTRTQIPTKSVKCIYQSVPQFCNFV